jgi:N6-L-threonylcarbamoyladenine synthase
MKILSIETSCDETAISIVVCEGGLESPVFNVLGNSLYSQIDIHKEYGGVYPMLAKREHEKNLPILLEKTLEQAGMSKGTFDTNTPHIDLIAVTSGPGLEPALWAGITFAQDLAKKWSKPLVGVNHMEGHITSVLLSKTEEFSMPTFPALALLISGGHTELVEIKNWGEYKVIGKTRDDAVGEAFDKVARLLGLPYPGGPEISKLAAKAREGNLPKVCKLPRPMLHSKDLDFSFSGLKTAVLYYIRDNSKNLFLAHSSASRLDPLSGGSDADSASERAQQDFSSDIAREFEDAVVEVLVEKTKSAIDEVGAKTLIIAGGVIANKKIREAFSELASEYSNFNLLTPTIQNSTDNALMIASAAYVEICLHPELLKTGSPKIVAKGNLEL